MAGCLIAAPVAFAHIERASYWPDPGVDNSVKPGVGGKVPKTRSLESALDKKAVGDTFVVCASDSMKLLRKDLKVAKNKGFKLRLSAKKKKIGPKKADELLDINKKLRKRCKFNSIQDAVDASGNNDRVVIMPGVYTEPESRAAPTQDPKCADLVVDNSNGSTTALSYAYHLKCPNDQSLINISGRALGPGTDPQPPLLERRGIPNLGPCIHCGLQIEGSGPTSNDVVIDAGRVE